jgi:hypothetical protein
LRAEGAGNVIGQFDWFLRGATKQQSGIKSRENFTERQGYRLLIVFAAEAGEQVGRGLAQFAESDFHRTERELGEDFFQRNGNRRACRQCLHDFPAQFQRQPGDNGLQLQFQFACAPGGNGFRHRFRPAYDRAFPANWRRNEPRGWARGKDARTRQQGPGGRARRFRHGRFTFLEMPQQTPKQPGNFCLHGVRHATHDYLI